MAAGDVFQPSFQIVAQDNYYNIQPGTNVEVVIHNIAHSTDAVLEYFDGTVGIPVDTQTGSGAWMGMFLHCTNTKFYRVKNTNSASNTIGCDGMVTK